MDPHPAYVPWRQFYINGVTFLINLCLVLALAALTYSFDLVRDQHFTNFACNCERWVFIFSLVALSISFLCGAFAMVCRIREFYFNWHIDKATSNQCGSEPIPPADRAKTKEYQRKIDCYGRLVQISLGFEVVAFTVGIILLFCAICFRYPF